MEAVAIAAALVTFAGVFAVVLIVGHAWQVGFERIEQSHVE